MFNECSLFEFLPDISNWNTSNIELVRSLFFGCSSLKKIPDISKWDISNV